ncbi:MAG: GWxTD domain-containing protein [Thermoanaerobaculia bacterium]
MRAARGSAAPTAVLLVALVAGCASGPPAASEDLVNFRLGPEWSSFLLGAISRLATADEIRAFQALADDDAARAWVAEFWRRRDPDPDLPGNPFAERYAARALEADKHYSEGGFNGRRTDRGTIFVLYGPPAQVKFESSPKLGEPPIEVWLYQPDAKPGLDGRPPQPRYEFVHRDELTRFYRPVKLAPRDLAGPDPGDDP